MKLDVCKTCMINAICIKAYDALCQNAINEIAYLVYTKKSIEIFEENYFFEKKMLFNNESINYIKNQIRKRNPEKHFSLSTITKIEKDIDKYYKKKHERLMDQIYGTDDYGMAYDDDDPPGYNI